MNKMLREESLRNTHIRLQLLLKRFHITKDIIMSACQNHHVDPHLSHSHYKPFQVSHTHTHTHTHTHSLSLSLSQAVLDWSEWRSEFREKPIMKQRARQMLSKGQERQTDSVCVCVCSFTANLLEVWGPRVWYNETLWYTHTPEIFTLTFTLSSHLTTSHTRLKY